VATFDEYMAAAGRAHAAGDTDAARTLVQAAMRARAEPVAPPSVPETPIVPEPPGEPVAPPVAPPVDAPTFDVGEARIVETEAELPGFEIPPEPSLPVTRERPRPASFEREEETAARIRELVDERIRTATRSNDYRRP
jgi:hypothetical protein